MGIDSSGLYSWAYPLFQQAASVDQVGENQMNNMEDLLGYLKYRDERNEEILRAMHDEIRRNLHRIEDRLLSIWGAIEKEED